MSAPPALLRKARTAARLLRDALRRRSSPAQPWSGGGAPRVLFLCDTDGAPARYRVFNQAEQLRLAGGSAAVCDPAFLGLGAWLARCDALVCYRLAETEGLRRAMAAARARGAAVVCDTDDLTWDERLVEYCELDRYYGAADVALFRRRFARERALLARADALVASTAYLAGRLRADFAAPALVSENALGLGALQAGAAAAASRARRRAPLTVAYFSGAAKTHEADLAAALPGVARALAELPGARLRIVGHLSPEAIPAELRGRVELAPFVPYERLFAAIADCDISLAPLVDNPHRRSKSAVKFLEAAVAGVPTVASDMEPYRLIAHGATGMLAADEGGWRDAVLALGRDAALRGSVGAAARAQVLAGHTAEARAPGYAALLRGIIGRARDRI